MLTTVNTAPILTEISRMAKQAGLTVTHFSIANRVVTEGMGSMVWVRMSGARLVAEGVIGQPLADALEAENVRRADAVTLYAFVPFVTLMAFKPPA